MMLLNKDVHFKRTVGNKIGIVLEEDLFCPNCGEAVPRDTFLCGEEIKECICGAKVPEGQFMCMECGRKIE